MKRKKYHSRARDMINADSYKNSKLKNGESQFIEVTSADVAQLVAEHKLEGKFHVCNSMVTEPSKLPENQVRINFSHQISV